MGLLSETPTGAIMAGATEGIKTLAGIAQAFAGARILKKTPRPEYDIAPEYSKNVALAQTVKNTGMAPEAYNKAQRNISRNMTFGMKSLADRRGSIAGISSIVGRSNDAQANLDATNAEIANRNLVAGTQMEMGANSQLGMQKNAKMQWEKLNPYNQKIAQGQALLGSGMQNIFGGLKGMANIGLTSAYPGATNAQGNG